MSRRSPILLLSSLAALAALAALVALVAILAAPAGHHGAGPSSARSGETTSGEGRSGEGRSGEGRSGEATNGEARSGGATNGETRSGEATNASGFDGAALPPSPAPGFTLTNQTGRAVSLKGLRGRVVVLTFLYSTCGATCILIAQQIRGALDELAQPVPVLIVSANPRADTPASVARFLSQVSLSGRASYLSGPPTQLRSIWRAYRVHPASAGRAAFQKYAFLLLLDPEGRERVLFEPEELTPEGLAHDIQRLQEG